MQTSVLVDFSHFANLCWYPALSAEQAGQNAFTEHLAACEVCQSGDHCDAARQIVQYDAKKVLKTNLSFKIETVEKEIGIPVDKWIFVKDDHATAKYDLFPAYKGTRDKDRLDPRPLAESYVREMAPGARWMYSVGNEADDAIASLTAAIAALGGGVVIVSSDKDLWALLQYPNVDIYSSAHKSFITPDHIEKAFGLRDPKFIALHKSLWGDSGDNVPNAVPRMQKQLIPVIESSDGSLGDFLSKAEVVTLTPRCRQLLMDGLEQIKVNERLVRLNIAVKPKLC